ncbi:MAG TPA: GxxExxY protein [Polyangia bacterium]|nr:GxxExxY protein [Polyangia bacterium]
MKRQDAGDARRLEEPTKEIDRHVSELLGAAMEVHRILGPGFLESAYEHALCVELGLRNVRHRRQVPVKVEYKGHRVGESCLDLLISDCVVVELKAVEVLAPIHWVQVRSYLKATGCRLGVLINFNVPVLLRGVRRIILTP